MEETSCNPDYIDYAYAMFCDEATFSKASSGDYEALHSEVADMFFGGDANFSVGDIFSLSENMSGSDSGSGGGGDGD